MTILYGMLGLIIFLAGGALLSHLGAGSIPSMLEPVADVWVKSGLSRESFGFVMWGLFALIAFAMAVFIGMPLYAGLTDLGREFK